jgi:hypothetical protein
MRKTSRNWAVGCLVALTCSLTAASRALAVSYALTDIGTFAGYTDSNTSDTFTGNGFVGIYTTNGGGPTGFAHLFGLEDYGVPFSETELQVDISGLAGDTISSAVLSYVIADGDGGSTTITATSFTDTTGALGFNDSSPNDLGSATFTSNQAISSNSVNVTALLQSAINADSNFFALFLAPDVGSNQWTYTPSGYGDDSADVRLTVNTNAVPLPGTVWGGMLLFVAVGAIKLRRHLCIA